MINLLVPFLLNSENANPNHIQHDSISGTLSLATNQRKSHKVPVIWGFAYMLLLASEVLRLLLHNREFR